MREIKFRVFLEDFNEMFYDVGVINDELHVKIDGYGFDGLGDYRDYAVMQYTGFKDKNGKKIYEGDIISTDLDRPFNIVVFRNGSFMFQCHDNGKDYYDYMFSVDEESDRWEYGEVIGNIYENPELLEENGK